MKAALLAIYNGIKAALTVYPAGTVAVLNLAVLAAARFGWHITVNELVSVAGGVAVILAAFVHTATVPKTKLEGK